MKRLMRLANLVFVILSSLLFGACEDESAPNEQTQESVAFEVREDSLEYSKCLKFEKYGDIRVVSILDPWNNYEVKEKIALVRAGQQSDGIKFKKIDVPIHSIVPFSSTHIGMIERLELLNSVVGVANPAYVYNPTLLNGIERGEIKALGVTSTMDIEGALLLNPDAIVVSGSESGDMNLEKLRKAGVLVLENMEWMELHPLGRAEWIKFFGALYDQEELANLIFESVEQEYVRVKELVAKSGARGRSVLSGSLIQDVWYQPGGESYFAEILRDAGASYHWFDEGGSGSLHLSPETVLEHQLDAEIWLNPLCTSFKELIEKDNRYESFKAYQEGNIFSSSVSEIGGKNYWESGTIDADIVLKDLVKIIQPDLLENHDLVYFQKLN